MAGKRPLGYRSTGVLDNTQLGLSALVRRVSETLAFRAQGPGRRVVDIGFFASVVEITDTLGLALCTDGVGSKVLVAEMLHRYDTIGIDCVAMNVNDAICVGAEPISFLDYIAIERATPEMLAQIAEGLYAGAELARVGIVGGEISQIPDIVKGHGPGAGLDLVGMCAGIVPLDRIILGERVAPGDVIVGVRSSGVHSNGLTLARKALFEAGGLRPDQEMPELGRTPPQNLEAEMAVLGAALLEEDALVAAAELLDAESFYKEAHRQIFSAMVALYKSSVAVDFVTLKDELQKRDWLVAVGGASYLTTLTSVVR